MMQSQQYELTPSNPWDKLRRDEGEGTVAGGGWFAFDRVHLLKCEQEGEGPMCKIAQSFVDEGKIIGVVEYLREDEKMSDDQIIERSKSVFSLMIIRRVYSSIRGSLLQRDVFI